MSLTAEDLHQIKAIVGEVTTPQFVSLRDDMISLRTDMGSLRTDMDSLRTDMTNKFNSLAKDIDHLAFACQEQFTEVLGEIRYLKEDVAVIKDIVKDHSFRIARLEHKTG